VSLKALDGVKVLELANFVAGPLASRVLGDLGATVYKVERPGRGDDGRHFPPHFGDTGAFYIQCNRNKESIAVDLTQPRGREVVASLARQCDVFLTNFRLGALRRLGLDYESLRASHDRLIYATVTGFGAFGGETERAAYDASMQALCGFMRSSGSTEERPLGVGPAVIDNAAAVWAAVGILAALHERDATGRGQWVDTSLAGAAMDIMATDILRLRATGERPRRRRAHDLYQGSDGGWIQLAVGNDRVFERVCEVVGRPDLAADPRYARADARGANGEELGQIFGAAFAKRPVLDWEADLVAAGVPAAAVRHIDEVLDEEWLVGSRIETYTEESGRQIPQVRSPIDFPDHQPQVRTAPQPLGLGTRAVLARELGMSAKDLDDLQRDGAIYAGSLPRTRPAEAGPA
jgi:crotonobetainyl-CoA:carnitine CoA-transferase CaiB-like acyl-CoA transferase